MGMTHIITVEEKTRTPHFKQEVLTPVTIVEIPKTVAFGIRLYKKNDTGALIVAGEVWRAKLDKEFKRKVPMPKEVSDDEFKKKLEGLQSVLDKAVEVRLLLYTLSSEAGLPKKTPDIIESRISGSDLKANLEYAIKLLQADSIKFVDHFKVGEYIDVTGVTKGKGFAGPVKRHGIKTLPRKKRKGMKVVGAIGAWHPARTWWTTPRAGQLGFHQRTEFNKKILKYSENPREINPRSGFKHYGTVTSPFILIEGSTLGSSKRFVRLRKSMLMTPKEYPEAEEVKISYISTTFRAKETEEPEET